MEVWLGREAGSGSGMVPGLGSMFGSYHLGSFTSL